MSLSMKEIAKLSWGAMDEEQRQLTTSLIGIKKECMRKVEDLFVQRYHDAPTDELYALVDEINNTNDLDDVIREIIYCLVLDT